MGVPFLFPIHLPLGIKSGLGGCRITLLLEEGGDDETSGLKLYFPRCIYMASIQCSRQLRDWKCRFILGFDENWGSRGCWVLMYFDFLLLLLRGSNDGWEK